MNKAFYFLLTLGLFTASCGKEAETIQTEPVKQRQLKVDNRRFFSATCPITIIGGGERVGMHCVNSFSNNCRKLRPCTEVSLISPSIASFFTEEEFNDWANVDLTTKGRDFEMAMWEAGWFYHPDGE